MAFVRRLGRMRAERSGTALATTMFLLLLALILPACAGGAVRSDDGGSSAGGDAGQGGEGAGGAGEAAHSDAPVVAEDAAGLQAMMMEDTGGDLPASAVTAGDQPLPEDFDRSIVKTAELGIEVADVREGAAEAQQIAARFDGSVLSSRIEGDDDSVTADLVLTVPSQEFEGALNELRDLGKEVTTDTVRGEDVTEEFVDLESRERNLLAAEQSLLGLYERADNVGDALSIERELTNIRGQIEQVQGRIQYLDQRATTSQISLNVQPVPSPPAPPDWSPARVVAQSWDASLDVLQTIATAIISAVVFGWWLVPALVVGLVWWRRRARSSTPAASSGP
jgi:hypothetical protein